MGLGDLKQAFFDGYLERHPEEATTLGRSEGSDRLRDHSPQALDEERRWYVAMAARLDASEAELASDDDRIDHAMMKRVVDHHLHLWDDMWCAVDWSVYPYNMLMVQQIHAATAADWRAIRERAAAIPRFLQQHEANLRRGASDGRRPDGALCEFFIEQQIPPASAYLRDELAKQPVVGEAAIAAADAYDAHARWLKEVLLPQASPAHRIGAAEVQWRLRNVLAIPEPAPEWIARARGQLERVQQLLLECARRIDPSIRDLDAVRALTKRMQEVTIGNDADVLSTYRAYFERALAHVRDKRLFNVPDDYEIGIGPLPPGFGAASLAGNWPAPLLDPAKLGHFLVAPEAKLHRVAWAADAAVHEGVPGHHLQSFWWQRRFSSDPAPVRFLLVHDQVAIPRHYWGAMPNIEGYAVYSEEVMRQSGFFTPEEELFVLMAHGVRAARVIADLSLHCELMSEDEARRVLSHDLGMAEPLAAMEVRRYLQIPLQASTYLIGRLAIEDLCAALRARDGAAFDLAAFHDRFFSFGPADPASIARGMGRDAGNDPGPAVP